ncbi:MAG: MBL fold metallo-hydrolase [Pseudomonadota bacterium]
MRVSIQAIKLGVGQTFVLRGEKAVMVDAGAPRQGRRFLKGLAKLGLQPGDIGLMVITHGHWDHIGSAAEISRMTGAPIAMHQNEKDWLEKSIISSPPGITPWGRAFARILKTVALPSVVLEPAPVDLVLGEADYSLEPFGIPGRVVHTPGHSSGSVSVLLESGEALVGDLAMNMFPLRLTPGLPIFAEDFDGVILTWKRLLQEKITMIYPAHGRPFAVGIMEKALRGYPG